VRGCDRVSGQVELIEASTSEEVEAVEEGGKDKEYCHWCCLDKGLVYDLII
jgi:hypothetical protein